MAKKNRKTKPSAIKTAQRQAEAMGFRLQGYTYEQISEAMKCSRTYAYKLVAEGLAAIPVENAEELRRIESERLDRMQTAFFSNATEGDLNAANMVLRIMERRARLMGLDAPERKELTGKDGKPIETKVEIDDEAAYQALADALIKAGVWDGVSDPVVVN